MYIGKFDKKIKQGKLKNLTFFIAYPVFIAFFISIQFYPALFLFQRVLSVLPKSVENNIPDSADLVWL